MNGADARRAGVHAGSLHQYEQGVGSADLAIAVRIPVRVADRTRAARQADDAREYELRVECGHRAAAVDVSAQDWSRSHVDRKDTASMRGRDQPASLGI